MAEEIPDSRFKSEMMRLMETAILKIDGMDNRLSNVEKGLGNLKHDVKYIKKEIVIMNGQITDIATKVIEM